MAERLSSIELLPEAANDALRDAFDGIMARRETQQSLLSILNASLHDLGLGRVSSSGFNRYVTRVREGEVRRPGDRPAPRRADPDVLAVRLAEVLDGMPVSVAQEALRAVESMINQTSLVDAIRIRSFSPEINGDDDQNTLPDPDA